MADKDGRDELDDLDGLFDKVNSSDKKHTPTNQDVNHEPKKSTFWDSVELDDVARDKMELQVNKILTSTDNDEAISNMLNAVDIGTKDDKLRTIRIGENYAQLIDRLQDMIRYEFGLKRRETSTRLIIELLLSEVANDLKENGNQSTIIKRILERKIITS